MSWVAVAIGGGALLSYMGSQNAADAQTNAANQANATQRNQYNQTRQDQMPWMNRGNAAGDQMAWLLGLPGYGSQSYNGGSLANGGYNRGNLQDPRNRTNPMGPDSYGGGVGMPGGSPGSAGSLGSAMSGSPNINSAMGGYGSLSTPFSQTDWQADPGYAFRLQEGQKALERSGAAKGMTLSGAQAKALTSYGQGMGSQEYGAAYNRYNNDQTNLYNRLAGVAGTGQQANQFVGSLGANMANQVGQNQLGAGNAAAAGWTAGTGAISNGLNSWMNYNNWNQMQGNQNGGAPSGQYNGIGTGSGQFDWANGW